MAYHVVFDVSERFPEFYAGRLAFVAGIVVGAVALRCGFGAVPYKLSSLFFVASCLPWVFINQHNTGGTNGLPLTLLIAAFPVVFAGLAWTDRSLRVERLPSGGDRFVPARAIAPFAAAGMLLFTSLWGMPAWSAFDIEGRLASGDVTVLSGRVNDYSSTNWTSECFTVQSHRFCYKDGGGTGFHQTALNGGPIREGLQVRVTSVGADIVRLEVADGQ